MTLDQDHRGKFTWEITVHCALCCNSLKLPTAASFPTVSTANSQAKDFLWRHFRGRGWLCPCCRSYEAGDLSVGQEVALRRPLPKWIPENRGVVLAILPPGRFPPRVDVRFRDTSGIWQPRLGYRDVEPIR